MAGSSVKDITGTTDATADAGAPAPSCEAYCTEVTKSCAGANSQYADHAACVDYCKNLAKLVLGTADARWATA